MLGASVLVLLSGCAQQGADEVTGFVLEYATGSIPPPFNHAYRIEGTVQGDELDLSYELTYRYREGMSDEELVEDGYSSTDDLEWSTTLTGEERQAWLDAAAGADPRTDAEAPPPGADSIEITVDFADESQRAGQPSNRGELEELASALDRRARVALDHPREGR